MQLHASCWGSPCTTANPQPGDCRCYICMFTVSFDKLRWNLAEAVTCELSPSRTYRLLLTCTTVKYEKYPVHYWKHFLLKLSREGDFAAALGEMLEPICLLPRCISSDWSRLTRYYFQWKVCLVQLFGDIMKYYGHSFLNSCRNHCDWRSFPLNIIPRMRYLLLAVMASIRDTHAWLLLLFLKASFVLELPRTNELMPDSNQNKFIIRHSIILDGHGSHVSASI